MPLQYGVWRSGGHVIALGGPFAKADHYRACNARRDNGGHQVWEQVRYAARKADEAEGAQARGDGLLAARVGSTRVPVESAARLRAIP